MRRRIRRIGKVLAILRFVTKNMFHNKRYGNQQLIQLHRRLGGLPNREIFPGLGEMVRHGQIQLLLLLLLLLLLAALPAGK